jgi:hypothetical protein
VPTHLTVLATILQKQIFWEVTSALLVVWISAGIASPDDLQSDETLSDSM